MNAIPCFDETIGALGGLKNLCDRRPETLTFLTDHWFKILKYWMQCLYSHVSYELFRANTSNKKRSEGASVESGYSSMKSVPGINCVISGDTCNLSGGMSRSTLCEFSSSI